MAENPNDNARGGTVEGERLRPFVDRFEQAWQAGQSPDLAAFLPAEAALRDLVLRALALIDLELRLKSGKAARVEDYLTRFVELGRDRQHVLEFIAYEFELRRRREPGLALEEYLRRFPTYRAELTARLRPVQVGVGVPALAGAGPAKAGTAPTAVSVEALCSILRESQVLEPGQAAELPTLQAGFQDPRGLAKELLQRNWLTAFQVNKVLQGRGGELSLGPYLLLERIGEGGMGQVFKARHRLMKRLVALKVIRPDRLSGPDAVHRFHREIRAAAQVSHPNVVMALDASQVGDTHFLVMEYAEGTDLSKLVKKQGPLPVAQACNYVRQAALGLQHAHERGLVHRDIKPANLLLTMTKSAGGPQPLEGVVKVLDLGLARLGQEDSTLADLTQEGTVMGTPDFMAPEQAAESHHVDIRADLYSLGCTLYYLLTAQVPFPGGSLMQKLRQHERDEPLPVTAMRADIPAGLPAVLARMMAKHPNNRYQTPNETALALEAYCGSRVPAAIPVAVALQAITTTRDGIPEATLLYTPGRDAPSLPSIESLDGSGLDTLPVRPADADTRPIASLMERLRPIHSRRPWLLPSAGGGILVGLLILVLLIAGLRQGPTAAPDVAASEPDWLPKGVHLTSTLGEKRVWHNPLITQLALDVRCERMVTAATGGAGDFVQISDAETLEPLSRIDVPRIGQLLALSPDGNTLATRGGDGGTEILLIDVQKKQVAQRLLEGHTGIVYCLAFSADGRFLLSGGNDRTVRLWSAKEGKQLKCLTGHTDAVRCVAFSPDGKHALSGGTEQAVKSNVDLLHWDLTVDRDEAPAAWKGHTGFVYALAYSPDGSVVQSVGSDGTRWWSSTGKKLGQIEQGQGHDSIAFAPDGKRVVSSGRGLTIWDTATHKPIRAFPNGGRAAFLADSKRIVCADGRTVRILNTETGHEQRPPVGHLGEVLSVAFAPRGRQLASFGGDLALRLWDRSTGKDLERFPAVVGGPPTWSPDGAYLLTLAGVGLQVWRTSEGKKVRDIPVPGPPAGVWFTDRCDIVVLFEQGGLMRWNVESGKELDRATIKAAPHPGLGILSFDRSQIAFCERGRLSVVKLQQGLELRSLNIAGTAGKPALSPDNRWTFVAGTDGILSVMDLNANPPKVTTYLRGHNDAFQIVLTPDGKTLVSADRSGQIILWNARFFADGGDQKIAEWQQPTGVVSLELSPDGRDLITGNADGTIYVFRLGLIASQNTTSTTRGRKPGKPSHSVIQRSFAEKNTA